MILTTEKYRISHHNQEGDCENCGEPMFYGDQAYEVDHCFIVCSNVCVKEIKVKLEKGESI